MPDLPFGVVLERKVGVMTDSVQLFLSAQAAGLDVL